MATKKPDRFDQVDWESYASSGRFDLAVNTKGMIATTIPLIVLFIYEQFFLGSRTDTLEFINLNVTIGSVNAIFIFSMIVSFWYIVVPMYQNARMTKYYWSEFKRNRPAIVGVIWLVILLVGGLIGPLFVEAPQQDLLASYQPPVGMSIDTNYPNTCVGEVRDGRCYGTWEYPLGTTRAGKGVFAGIVHGMTISLKIAFPTTMIVSVIGVAVGTTAAYRGGLYDEVLMRLVDIVLSFPTFLFYLLILYIFGAGLGLFIFIFAVFTWGATARYVRAKSLSIAEEEYIQAIEISGASPYRVIRRHVVPNTASSIITQITLLTPGFILAETQLSFLGLGDSEIPSWGQLIASGRSALEFAPWVVLAPGFTLFLTILAINFVGDAILDALNPEAEAEADK